MKYKLLATTAVLSLLALDAKADMVTDQHGNVGYDTAQECDAAVQAGTAKFYSPVTTRKPLKRKGEMFVKTASISDLGEQYVKGACDIGIAGKQGREGVSKLLQGKYIPYAPDMNINVYTNKDGRPVRVSMQQCDNWFSNNVPRPVQFVKEEVAVEAPKPAVVEVVEPRISPAPVVIPVVAAAAFTPYVFGTLGGARNTVNVDVAKDKLVVKESADNTQLAGQLGVGMQFNRWLGAEAFYQGSRKHNFSKVLNKLKTVENYTTFRDNLQGNLRNVFGLRATLGTNVGSQTFVFAKAGVSALRLKKGSDYKPRWTAGLGLTHNLTDKLALRADYDHFFKKSGTDRVAEQCNAKWKGADYLGLGLQYKFK